MNQENRLGKASSGEGDASQSASKPLIQLEEASHFWRAKVLILHV
jgi:hypothetical protein